MDPGWATLKWRVHYQCLGLQRSVYLESPSKGPFNLVGGTHTQQMTPDMPVHLKC